MTQNHATIRLAALAPREKLVKLGVMIVRLGHYDTFLLADISVMRQLFASTLCRIGPLRPVPRPA